MNFQTDTTAEIIQQRSPVGEERSDVVCQGYPVTPTHGCGTAILLFPREAEPKSPETVSSSARSLHRVSVRVTMRRAVIPCYSRELGWVYARTDARASNALLAMVLPGVRLGEQEQICFPHLRPAALRIYELCQLVPLRSLDREESDMLCVPFRAIFREFGRLIEVTTGAGDLPGQNECWLRPGLLV